MSGYNGSGTFVLPVVFVPGTPATAEDQNTQDGSIATGLSQVLVRDGQAPMTGPLSMGGQQLVNVGTGVAGTDGVNLAQVQTLSAGQAFNSTRISVTGATVINNTYNRATLDIAGGSFFVVDFQTNLTALDANFFCTVINTESTAIAKAIKGVGQTFLLYPFQSFIIFKNNGLLYTIGDSTPVTGGTPRRYAWQSISVFVDASLGSDDPLVADGLSTGSRAYKTINHAYSAILQNFDALGSFPVMTINGVFREYLQLTGTPVGAGANAIFINGSSPGAVTWQPPGNSGGTCLLVGDGGTVQISNIIFQADGLGGFVYGQAIQMHQYSVIDINGGVVYGAFGNAQGQHIGTDGAGWTINISASYGFNTGGGVNAHVNLHGAGILNHAGGITITITGTPTCGNWFYGSGSGVTLNLGAGITWTGAVTAGGTKWTCASMALFSLSGNAANIPGSVAGNPVVGNAIASGTGMVV